VPQFTPQLRAHPSVLQLRWQVYADTKMWEACLDMRASLTGRLVLALALFTLALPGRAADYAAKIAPLIDPAKLATLGERSANPRVQKYVAQLAEARQAGVEVSNVVSRAVTLAGMKGEATTLTAEAMLRNLTIAERLGCLDKAGLRDMRRTPYRKPGVKAGPVGQPSQALERMVSPHSIYLNVYFRSRKNLLAVPVVLRVTNFCALLMVGAVFTADHEVPATALAVSST
jgi:hypothetical protein